MPPCVTRHDTIHGHPRSNNPTRAEWIAVRRGFVGRSCAGHTAWKWWHHACDTTWLTAGGWGHCLGV